MKYTIIKNSESNTGYDIPDCEFHGLDNRYVCGWQFELVRDGKAGWSDVKFFCGMPEECAAEQARYWDMIGCEPTGTVIFRGYFVEEFDYEDRDFCYTQVL